MGHVFEPELAAHGGELEQVVVAVALRQRLALLVLAVAVVVVEVTVGRIVAPPRLALLLRREASSSAPVAS